MSCWEQSIFRLNYDNHDVRGIMLLRVVGGFRGLMRTFGSVARSNSLDRSMTDFDETQSALLLNCPWLSKVYDGRAYLFVGLLISAF